jgi:uncharacterized surface protein with fasciclin (FAS1) repeats
MAMVGWIRTAVLVAVLAAATPATAKPLIDTIGDAGPFTVLLAAVKQAGLDETLAGAGPFTLLAPSDDAFGKMPRATYESLFQPQNKQKLRDLILHHVVAGTIRVRDVAGKRLEAQPMAGDPLLIDATRTLTVDGARVTQTDLKADNGLIHVVDTVLMPK